MNIERYKTDIKKLLADGQLLLMAIALETEPEKYKHLKLSAEEKKALPDVRSAYQRWYSEALALVTQLLPDRAGDFAEYYRPEKPRKEISYSNYTMTDYLQGVHIRSGGSTLVSPGAAIPVLKQQIHIVESANNRLDSSLFDIRALVQADLFDNELDAADELNKKGFSRGAGAIAGVVLEGHLATVCDHHKLQRSKNSTISLLNDSLRKADVLDVPTWRFVQRLGDLRNLCDHKKAKDPTKEDILELIAGVRKITKTVF